MTGYPVKVLGRLLGSAEEFNEVTEGVSVQHEVFVPAPGVNIPAGSLFVDYEEGEYKVYVGEEDESIADGDLYTIIAGLPRVY